MRYMKSLIKGLVPSHSALIICCCAMWIGALAAPSLAHNLWIVGDAHGNGDGAVDLYFEHWVGPGDGAYNGPIESRGKTWLRTPQGEVKPLTMKVVVEKETKYLSAKVEKPPIAYAVDHASLYGIYHGRLDFFYGRYIEAKNNKDLEALAESPNLPFQIVPQWKDGQLLLKLMYFSKPLARTKISWVKDDGTEESFITDNKGELLFTPGKAGKYHFASLAFEHQAAGAFEYEAFKGIMYGTTLTLVVPVE